MREVGVDDGTTPPVGPSMTDSNGDFERDATDRRRLEHQFGLLREDFNLWFDEMLRLGGLSTEPARADWSVLDVGCGEGLFTHEIARRYPRARVVGVDVDADAVAVASARGAADRNVRFLVHDIRQPLVDIAGPAGGFDAVVMWLVLPYLADRRAALANLAAALRPGGVLLLGNVPDETMRLTHPAATGLLAAARQLVARLGLGGLEDTLEPLLREAGFDDVSTEPLRYPVGGATRYGQRWHSYLLMNMSTAKHPIVHVFGLMDEAEYDRRFERLAAESVLRLSGEIRFLVTLARRG
jgi:2-polyprenyl-3-methyl-5-hydroxy-6-metoxy-1,4-benzoquinol methylase